MVGVHTSSTSKEDGFGAMKLLLQQEELVLPRHPELLRQWSSLEFEAMDSGSVRIAVPERAGHDDLAMGLMLALGQQVEEAQAWVPRAGKQLRFAVKSRGVGRGGYFYEVDAEDDKEVKAAEFMIRSGHPMAEEAERFLKNRRRGGGRRGYRGR